MWRPRLFWYRKVLGGSENATLTNRVNSKEESSTSTRSFLEYCSPTSTSIQTIQRSGRSSSPRCSKSPTVWISPVCVQTSYILTIERFSTHKHPVTVTNTNTKSHDIPKHKYLSARKQKSATPKQIKGGLCWSVEYNMWIQCFVCVSQPSNLAFDSDPWKFQSFSALHKTRAEKHPPVHFVHTFLHCIWYHVRFTPSNYPTEFSLVIRS